MASVPDDPRNGPDLLSLVTVLPKGLT